MHRHLGFVAVALAAVLWAAPAASAAVRYAGAAGTALDECLDPADPCPIDHAFGEAENGDELVVRSGTYDVNVTLDTVPGVDIHGEAGRPRPVLNISVDGTGIVAPSNGRLADLVVNVQHPVSPVFPPAGVAVPFGALAERLVVSARGAGAATGVALSGGTLRNSTVRAGASSATIGIEVSGSATIRGVTAIVTEGGSGGVSAALRVNALTPVTLDAANSIFRESGVGANRADVMVRPVSPSSATVHLRRCNFGTLSTEGFSNVTLAGVQTAPPRFAGAAAGDFHQAADSPTIDAGEPLDAASGTTDVDGQARLLGAAPDIGADERPPPAPASTPRTPAAPANGGGAPPPAAPPPEPQPAPSLDLPAVLSGLTVDRNQRGRIRGTLRTGRPDTRLTFRLTVRSRGKTVTIGRLTRTVRRANRVRFTVNLTRAGKRRLRRAGRLTVRLHVAASVRGLPSVSRTQTVRVRR